MHKKILPVGWRQIFSPSAHAAAYASKNGLRVMVSNEVHDGQKWQHVSVSRQRRLPSWQDIRTVKDLFIGGDQKAIMVLPPNPEYVNVHPYCMHLFCNLFNDPLPDFTRGMGIL
jgi:hypothetical protein